MNTGIDNVFPCIEFIAAGFSRLGDQNCNTRVLQTNNAFQYGESLSWVRGTHNLKFGLDYRWMETNGIDPWRTMGWFQFNALETALPGIANTGNAIASFLLGNVNRGQLQVFSYFPRNRYQYWAGYAQDDWKATRKLTVNYGCATTFSFPGMSAGTIFRRSISICRTPRPAAVPAHMISGDRRAQQEQNVVALARVRFTYCCIGARLPKTETLQ